METTEKIIWQKHSIFHNIEIGYINNYKNQMTILHGTTFIIMNDIDYFILSWAQNGNCTLTINFKANIQNGMNNTRFFDFFTANKKEAKIMAEILVY